MPWFLHIYYYSTRRYNIKHLSGMHHIIHALVPPSVPHFLCITCIIYYLSVHFKNAFSEHAKRTRTVVSKVNCMWPPLASSVFTERARRCEESRVRHFSASQTIRQDGALALSVLIGVKHNLLLPHTWKFTGSNEKSAFLVGSQQWHIEELRVSWALRSSGNVRCRDAAGYYARAFVHFTSMPKCCE